MLVTLTLYLEDNIRQGSPGGRGPVDLEPGLVDSIVLSVLTVESLGTGRLKTRLLGASIIFVNGTIN
jgi:hypothetical protein